MVLRRFFRRKLKFRGIHSFGTASALPQRAVCPDHGMDGIDATISSVQKMFPGHVFTVAGEVDAHHDTLRFQWHLAEPDADEPLVIGFDVAKLDGDRIGQVYVFPDNLPTAS
jgi:hypothetical protein